MGKQFIVKEELMELYELIKKGDIDASKANIMLNILMNIKQID